MNSYLIFTSGRITFAVMRIAVNARCLSNVQMGPGYWTFNLLQELSKHHPEHEFILFADRPIHISTNNNVRVEVIGKPVKNVLQFNYWLHSKLKKAVQQKADILVSLDGTGYTTANFPQIIGLKDTKMLKGSSWFESWFKHRHFKKLSVKAEKIIVVSTQVERAVKDDFQLEDERIAVIAQSPVSLYQPIEWQQKQYILEQYTDGKEFFLFTGGFDPSRNLLTTLKAFSWFKKWQQSNMKLLIAGNVENDLSGLKEKIDTFKFRDDVVVAGKLSPDQLHKMMASAYVMLYPSKLQTFGMPVLEAMRCGTPVIASTAIAPEVGGEAVMYVDADNEKDISNAMIKLYQDEDFRSRLIGKGLQHSNEFSWQNAAEKLWKLIEETVQQRKGS